MKKLVPIIVLLGLIASTFPAYAKAKERVGDRISLSDAFPDPVTIAFPAGDPFHIAHGWANLSTDSDAVGKFDFELEVDGASRKKDFVERTVVGEDPDLLTRIWVFNFPEGMAGTHTFTGHWSAPCYAFGGPCDHPNEKVEVFMLELTVDFTP